MQLGSQLRQHGYEQSNEVDANLLRKHFPESEETQKGHMKAQKSGIRSTKKNATTQATTTE